MSAFTSTFAALGAFGSCFTPARVEYWPVMTSQSRPAGAIWPKAGPLQRMPCVARWPWRAGPQPLWMGGSPTPDGKGKVPNLTPAKLSWSEDDIA